MISDKFYFYFHYFAYSLASNSGEEKKHLNRKKVQICQIRNRIRWNDGAAM